MKRVIRNSFFLATAIMVAIARCTAKYFGDGKVAGNLKNFLIIIIATAFLCACQKEESNSSFRVYEENGATFKGNIDLVGVPLISHGSFHLPGNFPSSTQSPSEYPWEIKGKVKRGIISIDFPDVKLDLPSTYLNAEGLTMGQILIEEKNNRSRKIGLHKIGDDTNSRVYILYVSDTFSNELVTFKSGWNFIEIVPNPNRLSGSNEPSFVFGMITQNMNVFIEKGYRWQIERWFY